MSQQKKSLCESVLREVFGEEVAFAGSYLCRWKKGTLQDIADASSAASKADRDKR